MHLPEFHTNLLPQRLVAKTTRSYGMPGMQWNLDLPIAVLRLQDNGVSEMSRRDAAK